MKGFCSLAVVSALTALISRAQTQICPFGIAMWHTGSACTQTAVSAPTLQGSYSNGANGCSLTLTLSGGVPWACCTVARVLVIGAQAVSLPIPGGCPLLASPDVVVQVPTALTSVTFPLPPDPGLIGDYAFAQGVVIQFVGGFGTGYDFTDRLNILIG
ncbi:MAG TPA: hypothetical protein VKF62_02205 [Planctomycetota bacterium]|nr:hypothetical protein [Planctomycetota bacterium]